MVDPHTVENYGSKLTTERDGYNLIVTLNRPEKRNALNFDLIYGLRDIFEEIQADPDIRSVIVRGEGPGFSAGVDFLALAGSPLMSGNKDAARGLIKEMQEIFNSIEDIEKPVIFAVHGFCYGMATEMILAGDFRIAREGTEIGINEVAVGLIPDCGGIARLTKLVGPIKAKEMIMTAKMFDADEAKEIQLFNDVVTDEMEGALKLAESLNKNAPLATGMAKKIVSRGGHMDIRSILELEALGQSTLLDSGDVKEGISAKLERRDAKFKGS